MNQKNSNPNNLQKKWQKFWEKERIFSFNQNKKGQIYSIDTPPPTVSGKMHLGHAFSYTQQDIIARYHRMKGENVFYPFGTDDNGLPTEKLVEKINNVKIFEMKRKDFTKLCLKTVKELRPEFIEGWKNIGMSCDFNLNYSTISPEVQKISQKYFIELYKKGRAEQKESPTIWCPLCKTSIAQVEMEDKEMESSFNDIIFKLEDGEEITIATTRPELLSSCVSIFVNPKDKRYTSLIGKKAIVPIFGQLVEIIADGKVNPEKGTGIVMCCTFGDTTDIEWYFSHNLPLKISINKSGKITELAGKYKGLKIKEARKQIIEDLKSEGLLIKEVSIKHSVNVHERCSTEIEILPTTQWFIKYLDLKKDFIKMGRELSWKPDYMRKRYENWVNGLKWDWCISRQRYFGIPFPIWYCKKCREIKIANISDLPVDPLTDKPKSKCKCGSDKFIPESDVLDTWATSSLTPKIAINLVKNKKIQDKLFPMSLRPQSHDIINFWLFYTIARSKLHFNKIPFKNVTISGFVLDSKGEKMSKSKGNVIEPIEVIEKFGADAMRYWATNTTFGEDIKYNEEEIKIGTRTVTKISNASKFTLMNLKDYSFKKLNIELLENVDKWILSKLQKTIKDYIKYFEKYDYFNAKKIIDKFFWNIFSNNYLELVKYRVYADEDKSKVSAQNTLYICLLSILKLYAPIIPFITEEVYQEYFRKFEKEKSIHLTLLPKIDEKLINSKIEKEFDDIIEIITAIRKFRSENHLPFKEEIEEIIIDGINIKKYSELIKKTMTVKRVSKEKGDIKINEKISITIKKQ